MKKTFLIALSILFSTIVYGQNVSETYKVNTNISKDACWNKINEWEVYGFFRYHTVVDYEDKGSGWIVVKGRYNPEIDEMISTRYNQLVPCIEFVLEIKCGEKTCTISFRELYYTFNTGTTTALDINNIAVLEASTAEMKTINRAGNRFTYNNELKRYVEDMALLVTDAQTKANDRTFKKKDRKYNQKLYDVRSVEFRIYAKAYNDMKLFAPHILREISVYLQ